jgi:hypothetical protein
MYDLHDSIAPIVSKALTELADLRKRARRYERQAAKRGYWSEAVRALAEQRASLTVVLGLATAEKYLMEQVQAHDRVLERSRKDAE